MRFPAVETPGYFQSSLRDNELRHELRPGSPAVWRPKETPRGTRFAYNPGFSWSEGIVA
jgi:hypothetical protein